MSAENDVKPCPFCGSQPARDRLPYGLPVLRCANPNCDVHSGALTWVEWQTRPAEDALRTRAEKAEAHLALILRVLDEEIQTCDAHAAASRSDALACRAAASAGRPAPAAAGFLHLTDAERIRLHENCATRAALEALGLRTVLKIVDAAITKAAKEPTT
jgi:hypothetical protein